MDVAVSGSHGLIGSGVVAALERDGHRVRRLVRGPARAPDVGWDPLGGFVDYRALAGVEAVVHLAGAGIGDRRWSEARKREIRESRVRGTATLVGALTRLDAPPSVLVSGSAVGYYGDRGDEVLTEDSTPGTGFLAGVCQEWEAATAGAAGAGIRVVTVRTGVVLTPAGGALRRQLPLFRLGVGGRLGSGRQYTSWISLDDEVGAILHALGSPALRGPLNLCAPNPATNATFTETLARVLRRPGAVPVPRAALSVVLGREAAENLLASQRALPTRLEAGGYTFRHPELEGALRAVLARR